ncbi:MAG TPA: SurA N-terminal domain-containing protein [Candidatus Paceibacterota bacterium]|nr:MAG: hypothetical protein A2652_01505 [Candidatus Giovannonibacteria bacterium RIFCSPHIGHO2_01_FULL_43_140]
MSEEATGNQQGSVKKSSGRSFLRLLGIIVILAALVAVGYYFMKQGGTVSETVAIVNGEKITRSTYDERYIQLETSITAQGQSATTTDMQGKIKAQTLDNLVTETLLLQAAGKENLKVNSAEVDKLFTQNQAQFADAAAFEKALTAQGFTDRTFKDYLNRSNVIQQYVAAHIDISLATSTEAEVKALYDQAKASDPTIPPLDQVRAQVENQIVSQKQQQLITDFIAQLRASSTIEILLK